MAYLDARPLPGPARDPALPLALATTGGALAVGVLLALGPAPALALVVLLATLTYVTAQPRAGFYLVVFLAIASPLPPGSSIRLNDTYPAYGMYLTPIELLLAFTTLGLVIRLVFDDQVTLRLGPLFLPISVLMLTVLLGIGVGLMHGANLQAMRAETRGLFYLPVLSLLATHFLRTRADVRRFASIFVLAVNVMAALAIYRYYTQVRGGLGSVTQDLAFPHEDAVFCAAGIIFVLARIVWSRNGLGEFKSAALLVLPTFALLVMRRRAGMVALDAGLVLLCVVLVRDNFRLFLIVVPLAILGVGMLLALTWTDPGGLGQPARSFRAVTGTDDKVSARDNSSDSYRTKETLNLQMNIRNQPVTGLGFGRPYTFYVSMPDLSFWPLWHYEAHNSVLWLWMKAGALAFIALLSLWAAAMMRSMQLLKRLRSDSLKPVAFALGAMVLMFVMFSYVDLGLATPRALLFFGTVLGVIGALDGVAQSSPRAAGVPR
ncbi:MAG: O-antigen ligase family protein [Dehalococcoidia bacterium]